MQPNQQQQQHTQQLLTMYNARTAPPLNNAGHGQFGSAVIINAPSINVDRYRHVQSLCIGATLIGLGITYVALSIGVMFLESLAAALAYPGVFCGIVCIISGSFGIVAGKRKTVCKVVTFLVLSILTSVYAFGQAIGSVMILVLTTQSDTTFEQQNGVAIGVESTLVIIGFVALIASIWGATLGCRTVACACCDDHRNNSSYSTQYEILTQDDAYNEIPQQQQHPYRDSLMDRQMAYPATMNGFQPQTSHQPYFTASHLSDVPMINA